MKTLNIKMILWVFGLITAALFVLVGYLVYALNPAPVEAPALNPNPVVVEEAQVVFTALEPIDHYPIAKEATGISSVDHEIMVMVAKSTDVDWQALASLYFTESTNGKNTGSSDPYRVIAGAQLKEFEKVCAKLGKNPKNTSVGGCGEMGVFQFMPLTWRDFGTDADGDGVKNPWSTMDAAAAAAKYLDHCGYGSDPEAAILRYKGGTKGKPLADRVVGKTLKLAMAMGAPLQLD